MAGAAGARLAVGRVGREAAGVADGGGVDAGDLPELALGAPVAAHAEHDLLEALGEGALHGGAEDGVVVSQDDRVGVAGQCLRRVERVVLGSREKAHAARVDPSAPTVVAHVCRIATVQAGTPMR